MMLLLQAAEPDRKTINFTGMFCPSCCLAALQADIVNVIAIDMKHLFPHKYSGDQDR